MAVLKKISSWLKYSKEGSSLTVYESSILSIYGYTKCPHCKQKALTRHNEVYYMATLYYCSTCAFSFTDEVLPSGLTNQGLKPHLLDKVKLRAFKINQIQKNIKVK